MTNQATLKVSISKMSSRGFIPAYQTKGAAGLDLHAANERNVQIMPHERMLIPTGLRMAIPEGYEGQLRPRSGNALKHGVTVLNSPGTIDSDYRGEIGVILINHGSVPFLIRPGDRIAQLVFAPVSRLHIEVVSAEDFDENTERGTGAFGSTGA